MKATRTILVLIMAFAAPGCHSVKDIGPDEFAEVFNPSRFRANAYHYYHGERDGLAYVSWRDCGTGKTHYYRLPASDTGLPRSLAFTGWDDRIYFDVFGDIAHLDAARERFEAGEVLAPVAGVSKWQYRPVCVRDAPQGTWAFWFPASNGKHGYLCAPGFKREHIRRMTTADGDYTFDGYVYRIGGLCNVEVRFIHEFLPYEHTFLKDWYDIEERP